VEQAQHERGSDPLQSHTLPGVRAFTKMQAMQPSSLFKGRAEGLTSVPPQPRQTSTKKREAAVPPAAMFLRRSGSLAAPPRVCSAQAYLSRTPGDTGRGKSNTQSSGENTTWNNSVSAEQRKAFSTDEGKS